MKFIFLYVHCARARSSSLARSLAHMCMDCAWCAGTELKWPSIPPIFLLLLLLFFIEPHQGVQAIGSILFVEASVSSCWKLDYTQFVLIQFCRI